MVALAFTLGIPLGSLAQKGDRKATEFYEPVPKVVTPANDNLPPSDAIVLFDGKNLDEWVSVKDKSVPAQWVVANGHLIHAN